MPSRDDDAFKRRDLLLTGYFNEGPGYHHQRPKGSRDWLLFYTVSGSGILASGSRQVQIQAGSLACYAPGQAQDYRTDAATGHWEFYWVHFQARAGWHQLLRWTAQQAAPAVHPSPVGPDGTMLHNAILSMHRFASSHRPAASDLGMNALEQALIIASEPDAQAHIDERVDTALQVMHSQMDQQWSLRRLAQTAQTSSSRLSHLFKEHLGCGPMQHLEAIRMGRAASLLLRTNLSIQGIAQMVGYSDPLYFSTRFRHHHGYAPRNWRQKHS